MAVIMRSLEMTASSSYPSQIWLGGTAHAFKSYEIYSLDCMPDGTWIAELRFDNLLHAGTGTTAAGAIAAAVSQIVEGLGGPR